MKGLEEQGLQPADKHRRVCVHEPGNGVSAKQTRVAGCESFGVEGLIAGKM